MKLGQHRSLVARKLNADESTQTPEEIVGSIFGGTVFRPHFCSRNGITYATVRYWSAATKKADLEAFKELKRMIDPVLLKKATDDICTFLERTFGQSSYPSHDITYVACGHSRREDCFSKQLAQSVATKVNAGFYQAFCDRFIKGSSHPKQNTLLPPLEWANFPRRPTLVIDDLATSGFHIEEAIKKLRPNVQAMGIVWLGQELR